MEYIEEVFTPLVEKCKSLGRAMRIGTNHGSLSARILSFYGDTPKGMVEVRKEGREGGRERERGSASCGWNIYAHVIN